MTGLVRIAVMSGDTVAARAVAGAASSLLTAVGRAVERVSATDDLAPYPAVVASSATTWGALRERYAGPVLVVDGDLLDGRVEPAFARLLGEAATDTVVLGDIPVVLPRPLPPLTGRALGGAPPALAAEAGPGLGYVLPVVVTPALRTVAGFWNLARLLESALAALLGESEALYVEPWPRGFRAARVLTYDLDALETTTGLPPVVRSGRPATAFCCADALDRLEPGLHGLEIAAHGDVHRTFADPRTALERIDRMLAAFRAAGLAPRGFSPPNTIYPAPLAPLLA